jgi:hypothetical protein
MWALQTLADAVTLAVRRPIVLMPSVGLLVLGLVLAALGLDGALLLDREKALDRLGVIGWLLILGVSLADLWSFAATTLLVGQAERGEAPALGVALRRGLSSLLPLFLLFIALAGISFIAVGIPFLIVVQIAGPWRVDSLSFGIIMGVVKGQVPINLLITLALIFFSLLLWGLFLGVKVSLAEAAVVLGGFGPMEAVGESWDLTQRAFWRLVGLVILIALGGGLLDLALALIPTVGSLLSFVLVSYVGIAAFALAYLRLKRPIER